MKKLFSLLTMAIAVNAMAATSYTWTYRITGDTAEIYGYWDKVARKQILAVSPTPVGAIEIPSTLGGKPVTSIGSESFKGCDTLTGVTIPNSVTNIGEFAFYWCNLGSVTIPSSVKTLDQYAFADCGLTNVVISSGVESIGGYAFLENEGLKRVTIPDSVKTVGNFAFAFTGLTRVSIGKGVESIGSDAFWNCADLKRVDFAGNAPTIKEEGNFGVFASVAEGCEAFVPRDSTGWGVEEGELWHGIILRYAEPEWSIFADGRLNNVKLNGWSSVVIPDTAKKIEYQTFYRKTKLESVTIPASVTEIAGETFWLCYSLKRVVFEGNAPVMGDDVFKKVAAGCEAIVRRGSTGWGVNEGELWNGIVLRYAAENTITVYPNGSGSTLSGKVFGAADGQSKTAKLPVVEGTSESNTIGVAVRPGYRFMGWYTKREGGEAIFNPDGTCIKGSSLWDVTGRWLGTKNVSLYAQWAKLYTITFYPNGAGSTLSGEIFGAADGQSKTAKVGVYKGCPDNNVVGIAVRPGYVFNGWYTKREGGGRVFDNEGVFRPGAVYWDAKGRWRKDADVKLYAQWKLISRNIRFYPNGYEATLSGAVFGKADGKSTTAVLTVTYGSSANSVVGKAEMAGRAFKGWYTSRSGGTRVYDSNGKAVVGNYWKANGTDKIWQANGTAELPLYAQWKNVSSSSAPLSEIFAVSLPTRTDVETVDGVAYLPDGESFPVEVRVDADGFAVVELEDAVFCGYVADGVGELFSGDRTLYLTLPL